MLDFDKLPYSSKIQLLKIEVQRTFLLKTNECVWAIKHYFYVFLSVFFNFQQPLFETKNALQ